MARIRIGCSGWSYKDWKGDFYPGEVRAKDQLAYYTTRFDTAEINASFYRLPSEAAVAAWAATAPDDFLFAWKVSRFISHNKKLGDCQDSVDLVFGRMAPLGEHQGPALVQLPPMLHRNDERLDRFLGWLPKTVRCTIEFRHPSWYEPAVLDVLARHNAAFCISDHHDAPSPWEVSADFVYVRGHGPGGRYHGRYGQATLADWVARVRTWRDQGRDVFVYFDNDIKGAAPRDAQTLKDLLAQA